MTTARQIPGTKACARCKTNRPAEMFGRDSRLKSGLKSYCRPCHSELAREKYHQDPEAARVKNRARAKRNPRSREQVRRHRLRTYYGITPEQFDAMLAEQGGVCAICGTDAPGGKSGAWHIDHCHNSTKVRGLLCANCNVGLGYYSDNPALLRAAANYVEEHNG